MFWALPWRAGPLALSTRDASRSFSLALRATARVKRRASPTPCGLRGLTRKQCGTDRDVFLEGFHVGFRRCVYANLAVLKDADFAVITSKFSLLIFLDAAWDFFNAKVSIHHQARFKLFNAVKILILFNFIFHTNPFCSLFIFIEHIEPLFLFLIHYTADRKGRFFGIVSNFSQSSRFYVFFISINTKSFSLIRS